MQTFDVCSFDLRRHGENHQYHAHNKVLNLETFADDVMELVNLLTAKYGKDSNWDHPLLVGHSYGGNVALEVGKKYSMLPLGIVLIDGGYIDLQNCFGKNWESCKEKCRPPDQSIPSRDFVQTIRSFYPLYSHVALNGMMESFYLDPQYNCYRLKIPPDVYMEVIEDLWRCRPAERYSKGVINCNVVILCSGREAFLSNNKDVDVAELCSAMRNPTDGDKEKVRVWWFEESNHDIHAENAFMCAKAIIESMDFFG